MIGLESRVIAFIRRHALILPGETVVIGVSGGADSVCLLHLLAAWQEKLDIELHIAHLNHQLRGVESEEDARYVANLAAQLDIAITVERQDVAAYKSQRNCSIEEAARELRYAFLARVADDVGAHRVAVGHTRDDQVETILMHILRGTGTSGLRGLEACSPLPFCYPELKAKNTGLVVIRPLLDITREETMNYCQEHQLEPRIDSSNLSLSFLRNRLRLEMLPLLRGYNPNVDQALLRLAEIAKDDNSFMEQQAFHLWDEVARQNGDAIYLDKGKIRDLPVALQRQILRLAVTKILGDTRDIEASHIETARSLLSKRVGKRTSLPHGLVCWSEYDDVVIRQIRGGEWVSIPVLQGEFPLEVPGETILPGWRVLANVSPVVGQIPSSIASRSPEDSEVHSPSVIASPSFPVILTLNEVKGKNLMALRTGSAEQSNGSFVADFDLHQAGNELFVRQRQPGDRFQPLGMTMPKKLQDFMVDAKVPLSWRDHIPIVCSAQQIVWVVGWRIDDRVKVTDVTKEVLRLEFIRLA